ncbi:hypothetical protein [Streptomyces sp. S.PB5]|uniref:hypothetical protein n=1 Tax=Streptomyces sp. S.PB5 TaxID=3020844 RepID=UPI0025B1661A|nr:hypothetical protein [Streptomyces sp. S.PB5]MDN3023213.1 hypothetical protein [Streptomyces sp. S.PB5]
MSDLTACTRVPAPVVRGAGTRVPAPAVRGAGARALAPVARGADTAVLAPVARGVDTAVLASVARGAAVPTSVACGALSHELAIKRRGSPLLVAACGRQGRLSRPAARWGRGFPGSAPTTPGPSRPTHPAIPYFTPVPVPALATPQAIRVRRSPR